MLPQRCMNALGCPCPVSVMNGEQPAVQRDDGDLWLARRARQRRLAEVVLLVANDTARQGYWLALGVVRADARAGLGGRRYL